MLDFYFIPDSQPNPTSAPQLEYAGGIEEEEFEMGQKMGLIESSVDFYGSFRWSSEQVQNKLALLAHCSFRSYTSLNDILGQAQEVGTGLLAWGD